MFFTLLQYAGQGVPELTTPTTLIAILIVVSVISAVLKKIIGAVISIVLIIACALFIYMNSDVIIDKLAEKGIDVAVVQEYTENLVNTAHNNQILNPK